MKLKQTLLPVVVTLALSGIANAALAVKYDFTGAAGDQVSTAATMAVAGLTAADVFRGSGLTASAAVNSISSTGWSIGGLDLNDYYSFSVTPQAGWTMTLESITFGERRSLTGIRDWEIRSSLDGFSAALGSGNVPDDTSTRNQSVLLPGSFANLGSGVEFRIYGFTAEAAGGTWRLSSASGGVGVEVYGSAVPEPHEYAMLAGLGLIGFALWRRRTVK